MSLNGLNHSSNWLNPEIRVEWRKWHGRFSKWRGEVAENSSVVWDTSTVNVKNMRASISAKTLDAQINKGWFPSSADTEHTFLICPFFNLSICHKVVSSDLLNCTKEWLNYWNINSFISATSRNIYLHLFVMCRPIPENGLFRVVFIWWEWKSRQLCFLSVPKFTGMLGLELLLSI